MLRFSKLCCVCVSIFALAAFETAAADDFGFRGSIDAVDAIVVKSSQASTVVKNSTQTPEFVTAITPVKPVKVKKKDFAKAKIKTTPSKVATTSDAKKTVKEKLLAIETVVAEKIPTNQISKIVSHVKNIPEGTDVPDIYTSSFTAAVGPRVKSETQAFGITSIYDVDGDLKSIVENGVPDVETGAPVSNLAEAVAGAREKSPSIMASEAESAAADAAIDKALAAYAPTVNAVVEANRARSEGVTGANNFGQISASLPIYTGGQRSARVKSAIAAAEAADSGIAASQSRVTSEVVDAYVNYTVTSNLIEVLKASEQGTLEVLQSVKIQKAGGFASAPDVAQVEIELASVRQEIADIEAQRLKSRERVTSLSGKPVAGNVKISDLRRGLAPGRDALLKKASSEHPQIRVAEKNYESAQYAVRAKYGRSLPQLSVQSNYRYDLDNNTNDTGRDDWNVGARLSVPLFDLETMADNKQSSLQAKAAYYRAIDTKRRVQDEFNQLWSDYISATRQLGNADDKIAARKRIVASAHARFKEGVGSLSELLLAQRDVNAAKVERQQIEGRIITAMAQILVVSGSFDNSVLSH